MVGRGEEASGDWDSSKEGREANAPGREMLLELLARGGLDVVMTNGVEGAGARSGLQSSDGELDGREGAASAMADATGAGQLMAGIVDEIERCSYAVRATEAREGGGSAGESTSEGEGQQQRAEVQLQLAEALPLAALPEGAVDGERGGGQGSESEGAVLVRPDGHVAWQWVSGGYLPEKQLQQALEKMFAWHVS